MADGSQGCWHGTASSICWCVQWGVSWFVTPLGEVSGNHETWPHTGSWSVLGAWGRLRVGCGLSSQQGRQHNSALCSRESPGSLFSPSSSSSAWCSATKGHSWWPQAHHSSELLQMRLEGRWGHAPAPPGGHGQGGCEQPSSFPSGEDGNCQS